MKSIIIAILLSIVGAAVEYRVQRIRPGKSGETSTKDGTTVKRTSSYREAKKKYNAMRVADNDTVAIRGVVTFEKRSGLLARTFGDYDA